jgi:glutathione S-transferase
VSWESGAVINYILRVYDKENELGPHGKTASSAPSEQDRVDYDKWTFFLLSGLGPMMGQVNWYRHYNPTKNEDALARYEAQAYRTFDVLEGQLEKSGGESVLPGGFSAVDAHFYPWVFQYTYAELKLDSYPKIQKWLEGIGKMPAVKEAYERVPKGEKA